MIDHFKRERSYVVLKILKDIHTKTEIVGLVTVVFGIGLGLDILTNNKSHGFHLFSNGFPFSIIFPILLLYIGQKQRKKGKSVAGNIFLLMGLLMLAGTILTSAAFQLVMIALLIYYGYHLYKSSSRRKKVNVEVQPSSSEETKEFIQVEPYFKNMVVGEMRNIGETYELDDIDIQYGFGDVHIDLSNTMIPEGETVILIRGIVGSIHLYVPYDIDLSIHTSSVFGKINLLEQSKAVFNKSQKFQTKEYKTATRKIKIITSLLIGDIEVRNV